MTTPSQAATLLQNTSIAGDGGYTTGGTIEGWIQINSKTGDPQRLLTLTGKTLAGEADEFWIEFSPASGKFLFPGGSTAETPLADGQFHHFAFTQDRDEGMSLGFDGKETKTLPSENKIKADLLIQQLTIGRFKDRAGIVGKIAGLHLWKKKLTPAEIRAAGSWEASHCPTPDFGFKDIDPIELLGYFNREVLSFTFYFEPRGHWVMNGTESDEPKQADMPDCDQYHHAIYEAPRYFLTTREKNSNRLYIISDSSDKDPQALCLAPDQSKQFTFATDNLILKFNLELKKKLEDGVKQEAVRESFSIESKPGKALPDEFRPVPDYESKCHRPTVLEEDDGLVEKLGDMFTHIPSNFSKSQLGWSVVHMEDPFDSSSTGVENKIFALPPEQSKCYAKLNDMAIPYGFKFRQTSFSEGTMHSTLVASGSDLRSAAARAKSIKGNVKGGCAFVSAKASFDYNSELSHTEENMYDKESMHSQHTYFVSTHTIVLDKANARLSGAGRLAGFVPDIHDYAKDRISGTEIFSAYGTHYAHAICYGARGRARQSYTKETMSALLQDCKKIGWGVEAKVSGKIGNFGGGIGGGYSQQEAQDDMSKISKTLNTDWGEYSCIGGSACNSYGHVDGVQANPVPVLLDLRPITELLAPPFFDTYEMTVNVRRKLIGDLENYLRGNKPRGVDVFHYLSLSFLQPQPDCRLEGQQIDLGLGKFCSHLPATVKVSGSSSGDKSALLQLPPFIGEWDMLLQQTFCYSGSKTDQQISMEFALPKATPGQNTPWNFGACELIGEPQVMKLNFALDDERLYSKEGVTGAFVLPPTKVGIYFGNQGGEADLSIKFPVVLKKLNLQDAFFNGLPAEWKENLKSLLG